MDEVKFVKIEKADLEMIRKWRNSTEVGQYMYTDEKITPEQQEHWFKKIKKEKTSQYWIIEYQEKKLGVVSINNIDLNHRKCYWGFYIGDSSIRGQGIGAKVEYNILKTVFEDLQLNKLCGEVLSFNEKVIQMHENFGFRREGYLRQQIRKNGKYLDVITIGLLKSEWEQIRESLYKRIYKPK